ILTDIGRTAARTLMNVFPGYSNLITIITVPCRNAVTPPKLAGNTPVVDVFDPVQIDFLETFRNETYTFAGTLRLDCRFRQRFHLDKPLRRQIRFHNDTCTVAMSNLVYVLLNFDQYTLFLKIFDKLLAAFEAVQPLIFAGIF